MAGRGPGGPSGRELVLGGPQRSRRPRGGAASRFEFGEGEGRAPLPTPGLRSGGSELWKRGLARSRAHCGHSCPPGPPTQRLELCLQLLGRREASDRFRTRGCVRRAHPGSLRGAGDLEGDPESHLPREGGAHRCGMDDPLRSHRLCAWGWFPLRPPCGPTPPAHPGPEQMPKWGAVQLPRTSVAAPLSPAATSPSSPLTALELQLVPAEMVPECTKHSGVPGLRFLKISLVIGILVTC